jgi:hypothetical protein
MPIVRRSELPALIAIDPLDLYLENDLVGARGYPKDSPKNPIVTPPKELIQRVQKAQRMSHEEAADLLYVGYAGLAQLFTESGARPLKDVLRGDTLMRTFLQGQNPTRASLRAVTFGTVLTKLAEEAGFFQMRQRNRKFLR